MSPVPNPEYDLTVLREELDRFSPQIARETGDAHCHQTGFVVSGAPQGAIF